MAEDPRWTYLQSVVQRALNIKSDKWAKFIGNEEQKSLVQSFFDNMDTQYIVLLLNQAGGLESSHQQPTGSKQKGLYFMKADPLVIPKENIQQTLKIGDLSQVPLNHFSRVVDNLNVLLDHNEYVSSWPTVVCADVQTQIHSIKSEVYEVSGSFSGRTLLPMPAGIYNDQEIVSTADILYKIESIVIKWTHQVRSVLDLKSGQLLIDGENPGPQIEIKFWEDQMYNLECIFDQLCAPKVKKMTMLLKQKNSSYYTSLVDMFDDVRCHLEEARDISIHLKPVRSLLDDIEQTDMADMEPKLSALYHLICLIWASSEHYRRPSRIVILLQEVGNFVIELIKTYLDPENILKAEVDEAFDQITIARKVLFDFKRLYLEYKEKLPSYFKEGAHPVLWEFRPVLVFHRFDKFTQRIELVLSFFQSTIEMLNLEKVEIGGIRGASLSAQVVSLHQEFTELHKTMTEISYDCLDPENRQFNADHDKFTARLLDIDRRLGTLLCQAFDDCYGVEQMFKLMAIAGNLIERPVVKAEFDFKHEVLLEQFDEELDASKHIFDTQGQNLLVHKNQPPVAGRLKWANELLRRISEPRERFNLIVNPLLSGEAAKRVFAKYDQMVNLIKKYKNDTYTFWTENVDEDCKFNLSQPLVTRDGESKLLQVNFSPKLEAVLREVRYFAAIEETEIPSSASSLFGRHDQLRLWVATLHQTVHWYNKIRNNVLDVEYPLIESQLNAIDDQLKKAETELDWSGDNMGYIKGIYDCVSDLEERLQKINDNIENIHVIMKVWSDTPLFDRKIETKEPGLINLGDREDRLKKRYDLIQSSGERIHSLINENLGYFKATASSAEWAAYREYVDAMIIEGLIAAIKTSLDYLQSNMSATSKPFFSAELELELPEMVFSPSLSKEASGGFYDLVEGLIADIYKKSSIVERVSGEETYQSIMEVNDDLNSIRNDVMSRVLSVMEAASQFSNTFNSYSSLWVEDRQEFLRQFLTYGHILTQEEIEAHGADGVPESPPELSQFKEQIDSYEDLYQQVSKIQDMERFDGWFRISLKSFKQSLLNIIKKWSLMFKEHLINHVETSLSSLQEFIKETDSALNNKVDEGDFEGLVGVMGHIIAVKERQQNTDNMFEPLKQTIELLKSYNHDMSDEVYAQLNDLPEKWNNTKKTMVTVKQEVAPIQAVEVADIRRKCTSFDVRQHEHREAFRKQDIFLFNATDPYAGINEANIVLEEMEEIMNKLKENATLFEVNIPEYKQLKASRRDVVLVKEVWDLNNVVLVSMQDWKRTLWTEINIESMEADTKRFAKDIRTIDKEARSWDLFSGLETEVKNMITSLRVVAELQNTSIRDRHWHQLMNATGVKFTMNSETILEDLLRLNIHDHEDTVKEIVDKSVKEMSMEKMLNELETTWSIMEFEHGLHSRTNTCMLKSSEELIETLEDNQVQLQNLMTSKYIAHFLDQVSSWQKKLSTTDSVMTIWLEVQRAWSHLESIFIGSEDIRNQLPEDSKRFDGIDKDFKEIMAKAQNIPNVVEVTNQPGLNEKFEDLQRRLTLCEKSLAEYLETKRLAFPRFYFVAQADLLDILSNGNNPRIIATHLSKLFDNTTDLKFKGETKEAIGMFSSEREYVDFGHDCLCDGQVEVWLNRVMEAMRASIRHYLSEAVQTYEEKPREKWLFDYCAQVALTTTQIWWSTEVGISFSRLEEGYENSMKDYSKKQVQQLNSLITLLLGDLSKGDRQKIMTICTLDVHSRDIVLRMITEKTENAQEFLWQSQLRPRWSDVDNHAHLNICDAQFLYSYEYLGNTPRLVVTPLTDRCYITLTQSLHLIMGGAPAGPAGTGKTETTKDLGRALGIMVYVFNCSEQMDYKSVGNIYKGLAQTGAWGCFDEFNRISVEVLSVVAVQVKCIQDAIRHKKARFVFEGTEISLVPTVGIFITMNPGYAGRTELPENLKALFRPCAMVVPDFELIAENMLLAEGFLDAKYLAKKFITLYTLCKELLSKQDHYDWGLRAIKSVLVVAGSLKRSDRGRPEDQVLMRALRDFNVPKIVTDDMPIFLGLIGDLFPGLDVPRKRDAELESAVKQAAIDLKLQPEEGFCLKIIQLEELLNVRWSVFVIGIAGTGKSQILKSLQKTYQNMKSRPVCVDLNPKAVTNDELFGVINPSTREWKDGLFSSIMRDLSNVTHDGPKWILLDGDIDPMWIESLNTVMDDNKVLTLASNERIPLNPTMRLLFEISNLRTATPATVSRAGILYLNPADLGWNPMCTSWIETREIQSEKANMIILFDKYVPGCLEVMRTRFKTITPIPETAYLNGLCKLLECLLTPENTPDGSPKEIYELYFVWACVWAFGGALFQDQLTDHRVEFSRWWVVEYKTIKFPSNATVFDYYIDPNTKKFTPWSEMSAKEVFTYDPDIPMQDTMVPTSETTRIRYFMNMLMEKRKPVMLVGNAGSGKTVLVQSKLNSLSDDYVITNIPFNYYTTSLMLQAVLEKPLEKKAGRNYGPPGSKKMIYFIDDMNMPQVDTYGTVQPHTLIRQHLDYSHWYDRNKLSLKEIHNCQYIASMNPTAGSFTINPRLQRQFTVFAVSFPGHDALESIYKQIFKQHLELNGFASNIVKYADQIVKAALQVHTRIAQAFLPTAIKFHYIFNLRDLSNIFQGILFSTKENFKTPVKMTRLYMHESIRVYGDKLINQKDSNQFHDIMRDMCKSIFNDLEEEQLFEQPMNFCHFSKGVGEPKYDAIESWESINKVLVESLDSYNDTNPAMNLVLFEDAMSHILRINRILEMPRGNALLVGVGGSGKQSLSRLAAFISGLDVFQIQLRKGYSIGDLKLDLAAQYMKAGLKNQPLVFLMTDAQVPREEFLVLINDLLASGEIPELFPDDQIDEIIGGIRNEVKATGMEDTRPNCWKFFIERVRQRLKVILCFSPVGTKLRIRARKFPAIVNCSSINWFHDWPEEALKSVAFRFLNEIEEVPVELKTAVSDFMSTVHTSVTDISQWYRKNDRRQNYTTPKSFLEQIKLYHGLLGMKRGELLTKMERLENGLQKLQNTAAQVDDLKLKLAAQEVELKIKNEDADKLIEKVGVETAKVTKEKEIADAEEAKVAVIAREVGIKQADCERDLAAAEPALAAAGEALATLNKSNLTELKSFGSPPGAVVKVVSGVMVMLSQGGKIPKEKDRTWKNAKSGIMSKVDEFLNNLIHFDKENIHDNVLKGIQPYLDDQEFETEFIKTKSLAAGGLCAWVVNIVQYYRIFCDVEPKRKALGEANAQLAGAEEKLAGLKSKIKQLQDDMKELTDEFEAATSAKLKCQQEADATNLTISLANRLVGGLASENVRWAESVREFKIQETMLPGDVLLITAFISYFGYFTKPYREELMNKFLKFLNDQEVKIPVTEGLDVMSMLTDDAAVAQWSNEGLPPDRMSKENATILCNCERWPLMVDPQLQGIKWIKARFANLRVIRMGQRGYLDVMENAVSNGDTVLIENMGETTDPVLDPLLGRNTIKKGKYIKIGDKEVDYHPEFKLILHTKLANPHYQPEMQAQCTLINFTVTRDGLEDQLLADVVRAERPDLEELKAKLTTQQNEFKITLKKLEDDLLARLSAASGNFLGDTALVENLETTKLTATEIEEKVKEAKHTEKEINEAREHYRRGAERASLLYFIIDDLNKIHPMYQFSLKAFNVVFAKSIERAEKSEVVKQRVDNLIDSVTYSVYIFTNRGLFEKDKLTFTAQVAFQVLLTRGDISPNELNFLLRFPFKPDQTSPVDFLTNLGWGGIKALCDIEDFQGLDKDIEGAAKRWKKFVESECPEKEKFPGEWKNKSSLQKLCMMRCFRPDRMTYAVRAFIEEKLHPKYVENRAIPFEESYGESGPMTPVFFILSPGVDPLKDVERVGKKLGFTFDNKNFHNVSLGQGQEIVAEQAMALSAKEGHWVILQNIHLVAKWLPILEKKIEDYGEDSHENLRIYVSAEPAGTVESHIIPQGILESSIKITNEPPTGILANLHKALNNFDQQTLEMCSRENEFKSILNSLCYFHAVVCERRKFGPQGWNRLYPFNAGDLTISVDVLYNYLEANSKVPWDDLRYLFGAIMYGGHITDNWDIRLCNTYLEELMGPDQLEGELYLCPGYIVPPNLDFKGYHQYVEENLPPESPYLYGLHPNAEIGVLTKTSENLFQTLLEMQPKDSGSSGEEGMTMEEKVRAIIDDTLEKLPEEYNMYELNQRVEEKTPYINVALQEAERMNSLTNEIRSSLKSCSLGLKGELTITSDMEMLMNGLFIDRVPDTWSKLAYPSLLGLAAWYSDLLVRTKELENWTADFAIPTTVWLGGLFNPQSFLTAIMQSMARKNEWPLDKMTLQIDVLKKNKEDINTPPREGAYLSGLYMEGARWDSSTGGITESKLKELTPAMPVSYVKAIPLDRMDTKNIYACPVYKTRDRGPTFVWTFNLKTKEKSSRWILGGVALLLQN